MKRIQIGSKFFRIRKGKLVEIPQQWVGKVTYKQTIKKRRNYKQKKKVQR